jgi:integrase/recombinase XerD
MVSKTKNLGKKLMLVIMFETGVRRGELVNIKLSDIKDNKILLHSKGGNEDYIFLTEDINKLLSLYLSKRKVQSEYLFYGRNGGHLSSGSVNLRIKGAAKRAGISPEKIDKITAHTARKSCATNMLINKNPITTVQKVLRHKNLATTSKIYAKVIDDIVKDAVLSQKSLLGA